MSKRLHTVHNRILGGLFDGVMLKTVYEVLEAGTEELGAKVRIVSAEYSNQGSTEYLKADPELKRRRSA